MKSTRPVGRPPGPHEETLAKLLPAALAIFLAEGGAALTPTRLHRETGISRATIYRNWPEPADLIEIMLERATRRPEPPPPGGDLRSDLQLAMAGLLERFERRPARAFFAACLEYGRRSERVATVAESFVAGILEPIETVIVAAIERGELAPPAGLDVADLVAEVAGPVVLLHVVMGQDVASHKGQALVDHFVEHHLS